MYERAADVAPLFLFSSTRTSKSRVPCSGKAYVCGLSGRLGHALNPERIGDWDVLDVGVGRNWQIWGGSGRAWGLGNQRDKGGTLA